MSHLKGIWHSEFTHLGQPRPPPPPPHPGMGMADNFVHALMTFLALVIFTSPKESLGRVIKIAPSISVYNVCIRDAHCGELGSRVNFEYYNSPKDPRVGSNFRMIAIWTRHLLEFSSTVYDNRQTNMSLHDIPTIYVRHPLDKRRLLYENIRV